ncbi:unnamed protein product, partial [Ectocarpus sp. 12 AP-2014]
MRVEDHEDAPSRSNSAVRVVWMEHFVFELHLNQMMSPLGRYSSSPCVVSWNERQQWLRRQNLDMCPVATFDNSVINTKRTTPKAYTQQVSAGRSIYSDSTNNYRGIFADTLYRRYIPI